MKRLRTRRSNAFLKVIWLWSRNPERLSCQWVVTAVPLNRWDSKDKGPGFPRGRGARPYLYLDGTRALKDSSLISIILFLKQLDSE